MSERPLQATVGSAFVGRHAEMAHLRAGLAGAFERRGGMFLLSGEPGIGKTRLAEQLVREAEQQGAGAFWGQSTQAEGAPPYWPWVQILRSLVRDLGRSEVAGLAGPGLAQILRIVPELRSQFPEVPPAPIEDDAARFATSGVPSLTDDEAVDLGLCYGWISGQRKSYDEVYYLQKYVPRRPRSRWSQVNVAKVEELIASGRMRPSGLAEVEAAKADGRWAAAYESQRNATVPSDPAAALAASSQAAQAFDALSKTQQYAVILKLVTARTATARAAQLRRMTALEARGAL